MLFVVPPRTESTRSEPRSNLGKNSWTKSMPVRAGFSPAALALDVYTLSLAVQTSVHAYGLAVVVHLTCMPDAGASRWASGFLRIPGQPMLLARGWASPPL